MKISIYFFTLAAFSFHGFSQDRMLMNPNQALINLNPSFAGSNGGFRFQAYGRTHIGATQYYDYEETQFFMQAPMLILKS